MLDFIAHEFVGVLVYLCTAACSLSMPNPGKQAKNRLQACVFRLHLDRRGEFVAVSTEGIQPVYGAWPCFADHLLFYCRFLRETFSSLWGTTRLHGRLLLRLIANARCSALESLHASSAQAVSPLLLPCPRGAFVWGNSKEGPLSFESRRFGWRCETWLSFS